MKGSITRHEECPLIDLGAGVSRRILAYDSQIMAVEVTFEAGAEGAVHTHPHTQCSYVLSGCFTYTAGDEVVELRKGDSIVIPPALSHGTVCLERGTLLDIFTPVREDFLDTVKSGR